MGFRNTTIAAFFLICISGVGCSHPTATSPKIESPPVAEKPAPVEGAGRAETADKPAPTTQTASAEATPAAALVSEEKFPDFLAKKIDAAFAPRAIPATGKPAYSKAFAEGYRDATTQPDTTFSRGGVKDDPAFLGYTDGLAAGKDDAPIPLDDFVAAYEAAGYKRQTLTGAYTPGFEQMDFQPDGEKKKWWFRRSTYAPSIDAGRITVTALVSPVGAHGMFGSYERELIVLGLAKP